MKKNSIILSIVFIVLFFVFNTFSQNYEEDTLAVRAILDSNALTDIPVDSVSDSSGGRIVLLDLNGRGIEKIPSEIVNLTGLKSLDLASNNLEDFPVDITELPTLENLHLSWNDLTTIPMEIGDLTTLITFNFAGNKAASVPSEIGRLVKLNNLDLSNNQLTGIPSELGNLNYLMNLTLTDNELTSIPPEIGNFYYLSNLALDSNNLTTLPDSVIKLTFISDLDVGYNLLDTNILSDKVMAWLTKNDPDWKETQNMSIEIKIMPCDNSSSFSIEIHNQLIFIELPKSGNVIVRVYNARGRLLETLVNSYKQAGSYAVNWNRRNYSSGAYYFKLYTRNNSTYNKAIFYCKMK